MAGVLVLTGGQDFALLNAPRSAAIMDIAPPGPVAILAAAAAYERAGAEGFEALRASGAALVSLSPAESESFLSPLGQVRAEALGALANLGIEGQAVLDTFRPRLRTALDRQPPQLELHGATGLRYSLETFEDLKRWSPGGDQSGGPDGTATWILPLVTSREVYFRVNVP